MGTRPLRSRTPGGAVASLADQMRGYGFVDDERALNFVNRAAGGPQ
jgi:hypothetical protein